MSQAEVMRLLGEPIRIEDSVVWIVGELRFAKGDWLEEYQCSLVFDDNQFVFQKDDPFGGVYKADGSPSTPKPVSPVSGTAFEHFPRYIDLRWLPSSGECPVTFEVQLDFLNGVGGETRGELDDRSGEWITIRTHESWRPGVTVQFVGSNGGRWRVRARNAKGTSDWSAFSYFRFAV